MDLFFLSTRVFKHARRRRLITVLPPLYRPHTRQLSRTSDILPPPPALKSIHTPEDKSAAREWLAEFKKHAIPKRLVELTFARSSGPGGQNVNKVNTKACLRCNANAPWVPDWARGELRRTTYYVASTDDILITSTVHRSQAQNIEECLSQLHALLVAAASVPIKNDPTKEQQAKVKNLQRAAKTERRKEKVRRSDIKKGRRTKDWD